MDNDIIHEVKDNYTPVAEKKPFDYEAYRRKRLRELREKRRRMQLIKNYTAIALTSATLGIGGTLITKHFTDKHDLNNAIESTKSNEEYFEQTKVVNVYTNEEQIKDYVKARKDDARILMLQHLNQDVTMYDTVVFSYDHYDKSNHTYIGDLYYCGNKISFQQLDEVGQQIYIFAIEVSHIDEKKAYYPEVQKVFDTKEQKIVSTVKAELEQKTR